jgi:hypothetical protein
MKMKARKRARKRRKKRRIRKTMKRKKTMTSPTPTLKKTQLGVAQQTRNPPAAST